MTRAIRERPRYALLIGLGLACLLGIGVLTGAVLSGGGDDSSPGDDRRARATEARQAQQLRAARANVEEAETGLGEARDELERAGQGNARQRARAESWRRRALRLQRRNLALRRALAQARED